MMDWRELREDLETDRGIVLAPQMNNVLDLLTVFVVFSSALSMLKYN